MGIYFKNIVADVGTSTEHRLKYTVHEYKLGKDTTGEYLLIPSFEYPDNICRHFAYKYRKS